MLFNSFAFLIFFPIFLTAYFRARGRGRLAICLVASYVFYGWWDWRFLGLLMFATVWDYNVGVLLSRVDAPRTRRWLIRASVVENLGLLSVFKYFHFFVGSAAHVAQALGLHLTEPTIAIVLPIGISFYTFQSMSYTLDLYWRKIEVEYDFLRFAAFIALFPQLIAGPIVRAGHLLPQMRRDQPFDADRFIAGLQLMAWGYYKKVVVADTLAPVVDARFANPMAHGSLSMSIGVLFYAFQIYCDFSGYSDIAIGAGRIMGYDFGINFNKPYFSRGFREFWHRWHISLSTWLRDYLYIPLGGNRVGSARMYRN
ncbi:MAG TPA: MBOAT family O-acyltransferase, partial [Gemmatimonadaceae bacterium]